MFENPRRGRQTRNFTTNVPKNLYLKSSSEQIFSENWSWVPLQYGCCEEVQTGLLFTGIAKELNSGLTRGLNWRLRFASPALWLLGHGCLYMALQHIQANFNLPEISSFIVQPDFSLILCPGATKFLLTTFFILIKAIYVKFWAKTPA